MYIVAVHVIRMTSTRIDRCANLRLLLLLAEHLEWQRNDVNDKSTSKSSEIYYDTVGCFPINKSFLKMLIMFKILLCCAVFVQRGWFISRNEAFLAYNLQYLIV